MADSKTPGEMRGIVIPFMTPYHPETSLPASSNRGLIVRKKIIVRSMGIGRKIEKRMATQPGRPKRKCAVELVMEFPNKDARRPSLPKRSNHETAIIYVGMSRGVTKRTVKNLRKGKSVFPRSIPKGSPTATVSTVTREDSTMLCFIRVHWCEDVNRLP